MTSKRDDADAIPKGVSRQEQINPDGTEYSARISVQVKMSLKQVNTINKTLEELNSQMKLLKKVNRPDPRARALAVGILQLIKGIADETCRELSTD